MTELASTVAAARSPDERGRVRATLIGGIAILLWAALGILTTATGTVPPFELVAMSFALAFLLALGKWVVRGERIVGHLAQPPAVWLLGVGGLFGFHFLYFLALKHAPAVEANLINYTWPLLIVLFSALLPGERLRWWHVAGAALGLGGTALLVTGGQGVALSAEHAVGYAAAVGGALAWSSYSVLSSRFGKVPTDAVGGFCGATAVLALLCHLAFETTVWPSGGEWLAVLAMGLGPVGVAFFVWDYGVKRGNITALGGASYATPLLSTLLLVAFGRADLTPAIMAACLLIVGGAVLAARDLWDRRRR